MAVLALHTVVLQVSDLAASLAFYQAVLGTPFRKQSDRAAQATIGEAALLLHADYEPLPPRRGAGVHINFSVPDAAAHHWELRANGFSPAPLASKPWGVQFSLTDPDGYVIEFLGSSRTHRP
jgi:catechol 2,3-dioxygenase-like lactoylglutathione lyase family enzyme